MLKICNENASKNMGETEVLDCSLIKYLMNTVINIVVARGKKKLFVKNNVACLCSNNDRCKHMPFSYNASIIIHSV